MKRLSFIIILLNVAYYASALPVKLPITETATIGKTTGKILNTPKLESVYTHDDINGAELPLFDQAFSTALKHQRKLLKIRRRGNYHKVGNMTISKKQLKKTVEVLEIWGNAALIPLEEYVEVYQIKGKDSKGNVQFTGYYAPVINVNQTATSDYKYPIYTKPKNWEGTFPTRRGIEKEGKIKDESLILAYAKSPLDVYFMQMQGSGYVQYPNGRRELFSYGGSNGHRAKRLSHFIKKQLSGSGVSMKLKTFLKKYPELKEDLVYSDPSYIFFNRESANKSVKGAGHVPLTEDYSLAVDEKYLPLGACVLAKVPQIEKGRFIKHDLRFMLAQDVGGAIKGAGHVDLYSGVGAKGKRKSSINNYGQIWLLLAKNKVEA